MIELNFVAGFEFALKVHQKDMRLKNSKMYADAISNYNKYVIKDEIKLIIKCKTTIIKRFVHKIKEYKQHSFD